jgi:hypothetical protein
MSLSIQADPKLAQDASYHYSRAIYEVNKRIANSKHEEIPNATIFAVGCLVHAEVRSSLLPLFFEICSNESPVRSQAVL